MGGDCGFGKDQIIVVHHARDALGILGFVSGWASFELSAFHFAGENVDSTTRQS
jgi:hypothetical protein